MKWFLTIVLGFVIAWVILRLVPAAAPKTSTYVQQPVVGRDLEDDDPDTMMMAVGLVYKQKPAPPAATPAAPETPQMEKPVEAPMSFPPAVAMPPTTGTQPPDTIAAPVAATMQPPVAFTPSSV
jgi:hypothetical protein